MLLELTSPIERDRLILPAQAYQTLSKIVAKVITDLVQEKPNAALGLPTGRTPVACYDFLSESSRNGEIDWRQVQCFGLDDYIDASEQHSFRQFLKEKLYCNTNVSPENLHNPIFCDNYDQLIADAGGLDLCILGLGQNGHIAFNEPGTPLASWTHSVVLSESTRQANAEFFVGGQIPTRGVTMGISTLLASKRIILMVTGAAKKSVLSRAMRGPITTDVPASFLQLHNNVMVLADFDY